MSEQLILGGGCFWCLEAVFTRVKGLLKVIPGYTGDTQQRAHYADVCGGTTQHAEVIQLTYDPSIINLDDLLTIFFHLHDPTSINRQGNDIGAQYRSIICYSDTREKQQVDQFIALQQKAFNKPIVTQVEASMPFYPAEIEHHEYYERNKNQPYCQMVVKAKIDQFLQMKRNS